MGNRFGFTWFFGLGMMLGGMSIGCGSDGMPPAQHGVHGAEAGSGAAGAAGAPAIDPHAGHSPATHANLPAARPMLAVEPWDGDLALPSFDDENDDAQTVEVSLTAEPADVEYLPGKSTTVWAYNGTVPGPVLRAQVGDRIVVHFTNMLPEPTTIHWHGMRVPAAMDGSSAAQSPVEPGATFDYEFTALDAGTFWYHPHVRSDVQVEQGLYGAVVIEDPSEPMADMASDLMVLSDVLIDPDTAVLDETTDARMMMMGREGNLALVNGKRSGVQLSVRAGEPRRFRIINAASSRFFGLMVQGGTMLRVGGDRGLLEAPETLDRLLLVNGERADLLVWANEPSTTASVMAIPYERATGAGMTEEVALVNLVATEESALPTFEAPATLTPMVAGPTAEGAARTIELSEEMVGHRVQFMINGASSPDIPIVETTLGTSETWKIVNQSDMDHPFHMHGFFFLPAGEREWKDTINIPGNRTVTVMPYFDEHDGAAGGWMYHCHILSHAEGGMMAEVQVDQ